MRAAGTTFAHARAAALAETEQRSSRSILAPGAIGIAEVEAVKRSARFSQRGLNIASAISVGGGRSARGHATRKREPLVRPTAAWRKSNRAIKQARTEKYPPIGGREIVREIRNTARNGPWSGCIRAPGCGPGPALMGSSSWQMEAVTLRAPCGVRYGACTPVRPSGSPPGGRHPSDGAAHLQEGQERASRFRARPALGGTRGEWEQWMFRASGATSSSRTAAGYAEPVVGSAAEIRSALVERGVSTCSTTCTTSSSRVRSWTQRFGAISAVVTCCRCHGLASPAPTSRPPS